MDLIERYLSAVRMALPRDKRDDIADELRDELLNRREERQARLGRPLTRADDEALLKDFGHPLAVASRYGRHQYLIGPDVFPIYLLVLKIVLAVIAGSAVVTAIVNATVIPNGIGHAMATAFGVIWTGGFTAVGGVTVVFAALERTGAGARILTAWRPARDLPNLQAPRRRQRPIDHVAGIVVQGVFLLWWLGVLPIGWQPFIAPHPGQTLHFAFAPVWQSLYWPIAGLSLLIMLVHAAKLLGRASPRAVYGLDMLMQAGVLAVAGVLLRAGHWVIVTGSGVPAKAVAGVELGVNTGALVTLIIIVIVTAVTLVWDGWRIWRPAR